MIVDDNPSFLDAARNVLDGGQFAVVATAVTGAEALGRLGELEPELVLVDIDLAGESGFELTRQITERGDGNRPKLVLISTHAEEEFADLIAESPALGFLPKHDLSPAKLAELLRYT
jgi:CheY-like chemotaxis protein